MRKVILLLAICFGISFNNGFAQEAKEKKETKNATAAERNKGKQGEKVKKDGTPDMRYKENKESDKAKLAGPLKKDGTADMRYKDNKKGKKK